MNQLAVFNKNVESKIYMIRGLKVMLDADVAGALSVETKHLNENASRSVKWGYLRETGIESGYRFQLSKEEVGVLGSQIATSNDSTYLPWAYTQKGCAYFGTSMNSPAACAQAVQLVEVFNAVVENLPNLKTDALAHKELDLKRQALIMEAIRMLSNIKGYSEKALAVHIEQTLADSRGIVRTVEEHPKVLLDVSAYLESRGHNAKEVRSKCVSFGKELRKEYLKKNSVEPQKSNRLVDGAQRPVNQYTEDDRDIFDIVYGKMFPLEIPF